MFRKASYLLLVLWIANAESVFGQQTIPLQHRWEVDPPLGPIWEPQQTAQTIRFDVEQLRSRFATERLETARLIYREHSNPNFKQKTRALELLLIALQSGEESIPIRRAMVSAALSVADSSQAESIWLLAKSDTSLLPLVERKLVEWRSPIAIEDWRKRIAEPNARPTELATALEGLAVVGNMEDRMALQNVIRASHTTAPNRYLAASALGAHATDGLNAFAQIVIESDLVQRHLIAAHLLKRHSGETTAKQFQQIIADGDGISHLIAYESMIRNMPDECFGYAKQMVSHPDSGVRKTAVRFLQTRPEVESIPMQATLLNDRNLDVRSIVATNLSEKARQGHRDLVKGIVALHLKSDSWQGVEKSMEVAVAIEERTHCDEFLKLLFHPRPEVKMTAGWALMEVGDEPETLASMLAVAEKIAAELKAGGYVASSPNEDQIKLSYLLEAFGKNDYQAASQFLEKFIPKAEAQYGIVSRASAVWALGKLNKGRDNEKLRSKLYERMSDFSFINPENVLVRFMCHLALGEMAHPESRAMLEKYREGLPSPVGFAGNWALSQLDQAAAKKIEK
jgi:hypothetical protein